MGWREAVELVRAAHRASGRPLAVMVTGHNGSGKSTLWQEQFAHSLQIPLFNADRLLLSVLPEPTNRRLAGWAEQLRRTPAWMAIGQGGVSDLLGRAQAEALPFAFETVFSDWRQQDDGSIASKLDLVLALRSRGYFVLLIFVGLRDVALSEARVLTRVSRGGHGVPKDKLQKRFPNTQRAINKALDVVDAALLFDNSGSEDDGFLPCQARIGTSVAFDVRTVAQPSAAVRQWLDVVAPLL